MMGIDLYTRHLKHLFFKENLFPQYIILYLTDACNLTCRHCFYYAELNRARTIKFENLEKLAKSIPQCINISFTGGEPFVLPHLSKTIKLFHETSNLSIASIPTNGIYEDKTLKDVETMCGENPKLTINISVSLDGQEKTHDYIRMKEGGYRQTKKTLKGLCDLKKKFKNLNVGVITTINAVNEDEIKPLFFEIINEIDINQFLVNFIRGDTKELQPSPSTLMKYKEVNRIIQEKLIRDETKGYNIFLSGFYNAVSQRRIKVIADTLETNRCQTQCYAGTTNCVILPDGQVTACEIRTDVGMGNLNDFDWDLVKLIENKQAQDVRHEILPSDCHCSFECQAASNIAYNPKQLALSALDYFKIKTGLMTNHFNQPISPHIEVNTKLFHKVTQTTSRSSK